MTGADVGSTTTKPTRLRIGCGGGFWGDSAEGAVDLVQRGALDFLVIDYLAEITMALLGRARARDPAAGYVPDFVALLGRIGKDIVDRKIRVVVNAGGVNPIGCRDAVVRAFAAMDRQPKIALVLGDDLVERDDIWPLAPLRFDAQPLARPKQLWSANAYLGAFPIAAALADGADIVITGRCVDSALVLGPLIDAFGWGRQDYDLLAAGSLAGHIVECGAQATGGIMTDWQASAGWDNVGFPIADCTADGSFLITKPAGTGGNVCRAGVAEQMLYEIGDPAAYLLPDVTCDFRQVTIEQAGPESVAVSGACGRAPSDSYKVCATWPDGVKATGTMMIGGRSAVAKARAIAAAISTRVDRLIARAGLRPLRRRRIEVIGAEDSYGPHARALEPREVTLRMAIDAEDKAAAEIFSREFLPSATTMAQGITGFASGRPAISPLIRLGSGLIAKSAIPVTLIVGEQRRTLNDEQDHRSTQAIAPLSAFTAEQPISTSIDGTANVPLIALAYGRSGDKGEDANIGVVARHPDFLPAIGAALTAPAVQDYFAHILEGPVERFGLPGIGAFNFYLRRALDGGGTVSLRSDAQGKALAQMLMDFPVPVPAAWLLPDGLLASVEAV